MGLGTFLEVAGIAGAPFTGGASLALTVAGATLEQTQQQKKALRAQRRLADIQNRRARLQSIREARIARARVINAGAVGGVPSSSAVAGGAGSVISQLGSNINFLNQANTLNTASIKAQSRAATHSAIGGIAGSIFDITGGFETIFSSGSGKQVYNSPAGPAF